MSGELTGTRRAYDRCAACNHARQRHRDNGRGACADTVWRSQLNAYWAVVQRPTPCRCPDFIEPSKEN